MNCEESCMWHWLTCVALSLIQEAWGWYGSRGHCPVRYCSGSLSNEGGCRLADRACEKRRGVWIMYAVDSDTRHYCTAVTERKLVGVIGNWWAFACTVIMVLKPNKNRLYLWWNGSNRNLFTFSDKIWLVFDHVKHAYRPNSSLYDSLISRYYSGPSVSVNKITILILPIHIRY